MIANAAYLDEIDRQLDDIQLDARDLMSICHDRIAIADVEAQLAAARQRLDNRRATGFHDGMAELALERAVNRLAHTIAQARQAA